MSSRVFSVIFFSQLNVTFVLHSDPIFLSTSIFVCSDSSGYCNNPDITFAISIPTVYIADCDTYPFVKYCDFLHFVILYVFRSDYSKTTITVIRYNRLKMQVSRQCAALFFQISKTMTIKLCILSSIISFNNVLSFREFDLCIC